MKRNAMTAQEKFSFSYVENILIDSFSLHIQHVSKSQTEWMPVK